MTEIKKIAYSVRADGDMFVVYRGDEPLHTPRNLDVAVPTRRLADALVDECAAQGDKLDLRKMPLTQMTLTAIDISAHHRAEVVDGIMKYGETELICLRADEPAELVAEQIKAWQPYLDWCQTKFGAALRTGNGIVPFEQSPEALAALRNAVEAFDAYHLTVFSEAVSVSGSLVLGLALVTRRADAKAVFAAAEVEPVWQNKKWGEDPAVQSRNADILADLELCVRTIDLLE